MIQVLDSCFLACMAHSVISLQHSTKAAIASARFTEGESSLFITSVWQVHNDIQPIVVATLMSMRIVISAHGAIIMHMSLNKDIVKKSSYCTFQKQYHEPLLWAKGI